MVIWVYASLLSDFLYAAGRIVEGCMCWFCLAFPVKTKPDFLPFVLFQPSVYELVRQPNFASLSIIVEDFVKDSGATFSGMAVSCCPGLCFMAAFGELMFVCWFYTRL